MGPGPFSRAATGRRGETGCSQAAFKFKFSTAVAQSPWSDPPGMAGQQKHSLPVWAGARRGDAPLHRPLTAPRHCEPGPASATVRLGLRLPGQAESLRHSHSPGLLCGGWAGCLPFRVVDGDEALPAPSPLPSTRLAAENVWGVPAGPRAAAGSGAVPPRASPANSSRRISAHSPYRVLNSFGDRGREPYCRPRWGPSVGGRSIPVALEQGERCWGGFFESERIVPAVVRVTPVYRGS